VLFTSTAWSDSGFIEGKIQGASYVFNHTIQVNGPDDPKIVMENDFVLQAKGNKPIFLLMFLKA
jgi:hypothetical protein